MTKIRFFIRQTKTKTLVYYHKKKLIITHKFDYFKRTYQSLNTQDDSLWKVTKTLLKIKNHSHHLKKADGSLVTSEKEKANTFSIHLSISLTSHTNVTLKSNNLNEISNFLESPLSMSFPRKHTSPSGIKHFKLKL